MRIPRMVINNVIDHSVVVTTWEQERQNEAILVRQYPVRIVSYYRGTCGSCKKPLNISTYFIAMLLAEDAEKKVAWYQPMAWFNCPHCQGIVGTMQVWEQRCQ